MATIEIQEILAVEKDRIFRTVTRYENYPKFIYGVKSVEVERMSASTARATYYLSVLKDFVYTLDLVEDEKLGTVRWSLVKSDLFKVNQGFWEIRELDSKKSSVRCSLEFELKLPVPRLVLKRLLKRKLSIILRAIEKQARELSVY